jgi:hypothetical protein
MHYVVGRPAAVAILLRRYLPERLFERIYFGTLLRQIMQTPPPAPARVANDRSQG